MKKKMDWRSHAASIGAVALLFFFFTMFAVLVCGLAIRFRNRNQDEIIPEYVFTYAENQAEDYPTSEGARRFADLVRERTGGRIAIQVKAAAVMGDEKSILEQMRFGGVDFARVSISPLSELVPELNVLQMPYIYSGREHMFAVLDGEIGEQIMSCFSGVGLEPLSWYDGGTRSFYTTVPVHSIEDMKGLRIRVQQSQLMADMVEVFGAAAVPTAFDEVYSSIQRGEIDGAENSWPSYESERHYEVAKYYILTRHTSVPEMQLASRVTWEKLTEEDRGIIRECAQESSFYERELWAEREKKSEKLVREAGCQVIELSPLELQRFQQAVLPLYEMYCSNEMDLVEEIRALAETETDS